MKKLIIWDFDGVIADTEKLWIQVWRDTLKEQRNFVLTPQQEFEILVGVADKDKRERLEKYFPNLNLDADFMQKITDGEIYMGTHFMKAIPGVEAIFADTRFAHCIATGATKIQHAWKMTQLDWIENYMSKADFFTSDMVPHGKPAPDLFLLAAKTENYPHQNCIVIGDSLNDFAAAKAAGIDCIAFVGAEGNNTSAYRQKCMDAGVLTVCATMNELHRFLSDWLQK